MFLQQGLFKIILLLNYSNMDSGQHKLNRNQFTLAHIFYIFRKEYELVKNFWKPRKSRSKMKGNGWFYFLCFSFASLIFYYA